MNHFDNSYQTKRIRLLSYLLKCPYECDTECPFKQLKEILNTRQKYEYVNNISEEDIDKFLSVHDSCKVKKSEDDGLYKSDTK